MFHILFDPFIMHAFMRKAIVVCSALSLSSAPLGVFLLLRRMSLIGDALSHAILPGVAIGYLLFDGSVTIMGIGGVVSGLLVVISSNWVSSYTSLREDSSFSGVYLIYLSIGIILMSLKGLNIDVLHVLFGSVFTIDVYHVKFIGIISSLIFFGLAIFYRVLVIESFDTTFLQGYSLKHLQLIKTSFLSIVVLNLVASFQVIGTLMSIGLMTLPALSAYCWTSNLCKMLFISIFIAFLSSWMGLLGAFYTLLPAGPTIILCNSVIFVCSVLLKKYKKNIF